MTAPDPQLVTRFDDIYNLPDCRAYYQAMHACGFQNARFAVPAFQRVIQALLRHRRLERLNVLDFASGYGIGSLLLRHRLSLADVLARYQGEESGDAAVEEVIARDREWLKAHREPGVIERMYAIDVADRAIGYGLETGLFDEAWSMDIQAGALPDDMVRAVSGCDLVVEVGSVIHLLPGTLERILEMAGERKPWIIGSPIRGNESRESMRILERAGMTVESAPTPPFPHRRFMDPAERTRAIELVSGRGMDTEGYESEGWFHARLFLSRPKKDAALEIDWGPPAS